jgi:ubiquinone/menaquinone biosynthesis C-methylase UbiE
MHGSHYAASYRSLFARLVAAQGLNGAMESIVGGQYDQIGVLESSALITLGLRRSDTLIDVGCGSGRLPFKLRGYLDGAFIGTDILEDALIFAAEKCGRPDWRFIPHSEPSIPVGDSTADFVSFFSVFTHLMDEDVYRFLADAKRVAKPGGRIVFSFLDFECESHWPVFESTLADTDPQRVINNFISKGAIRRWAHVLGLRVDAIYNGPEDWVRLTEPFTYADGRRAEGIVQFGHSFAVLSKETPAPP